MCDFFRRCDRPSCPCNEPDTELKDALTRMQERFPAPWMVSVVESATKHADYWLASATLGDVEWACYGPTPHAAVDAAINAWDAAVKADALYADAYRAGLEAAAKALPALNRYEVGGECDGDSGHCYAEMELDDAGRYIGLDDAKAAIRALAKEGR